MSNPFKAGIYAGKQSYHTDAEDRIRVVANFDRAQCAAALKVEGLQLTVRRSVVARLRHLDKVAMTVHFEDHGQDFLRWELDRNGKVLASKPFQGSIWKGVKVLQPQLLRKGSIVRFVRPGESEEKTIGYPLTKVTKGVAR